MSQSIGLNPFRQDVRRKQYRTLSLLCDDEPLSDAQLKAYQTRLQEYRTFLDAVGRLALCGNVCITEELVTIGEHGLLTGESLNALQHAGAISVYNTLQQNNWEFPVPEDGEVAVIRSHTPVPDEFLDSEKPIRSDWPAIHVSECFIEGDRAKLHGCVRPLRTFLPPTVVFRNATDIDDDSPESELNAPNAFTSDGNVELVSSAKGISVKQISKDGKGVEFIPIEEYYFGVQEGNSDYHEEKGEFRFKCAVCQRIFYSNIKAMAHILTHVDESSKSDTQFGEGQFTESGEQVDQEHNAISGGVGTFVARTASQLLMQQRAIDSFDHMNASSDLSLVKKTADGPFDCCICGKEASDELALARHLQSSHRRREMPYVCRLCLFRSSIFEDILEHFKKAHDNSNHLLCTYCLRIFTPSDARLNAGAATIGGIGQTQVYLQHLRMHQLRNQLRRCPTCKLNFTNKSDYQVHRRLDHKATHAALQARQSLSDSYDSDSGGLCAELIQIGGSRADDLDNLTSNVVSELIKNTTSDPQITLLNVPETVRTQNVIDVHMPEKVNSLSCLECGEYLGTTDHKYYLPCSLCRFATYCTAGYNRHVQQVHLRSNSKKNVDLQCGMPMVRPLYFDWLSEEMLSTDAGDQTTTTATSATVEASSEVQPSQEESVQSMEITEQPMIDAPADATTQELLSNQDGFEPSVELESKEGDMAEESKHIENNPELPVVSESDIDVTAVNTESGKSPGGSKETMSNKPAASLQPEELAMRYMNSIVNSHSFACVHCGQAGFDGNHLARHLVEECGASTVTLNPTPEMIQKRLNAASQLPAEQDEMNVGILFDSGASIGQPVDANTVAVVMDTNTMVMDANQLALMETDDPNGATAAQIVTHVGPGGTTTIDVTNAGGEVVQQFILPDDLQLEEGQTLVVIHGDDGQPQLAIVNQADLIDPNNAQMMLQSEEEQAGSLLLYSDGMEGQPELTGDVLEQEEEEKENHQYPI